MLKVSFEFSIEGCCLLSGCIVALIPFVAVSCNSLKIFNKFFALSKLFLLGIPCFSKSKFLSMPSFVWVIASCNLLKISLSPSTSPDAKASFNVFCKIGTDSVNAWI